ncbi:MAG: NADP-dependent methylenetetrahydromethanopterin/methylenetetrahydrofolate dehydrogenase [Gammaproteobacteria bacterium]|nr:NADP-dependent methylenetetrahydromethanopterin/methylenetetrahydrofolate dehydrogenase [Gammaproteobacteria bacterium]
MKKLLYTFDTDPIPSVFDSVVAYDGGADHVTQLSGINVDNCVGLVEGAIYTRAPKNKKNTAIFIGGSDLIAGQNLFQAVHEQFFQNFRVSLMLDSNGCNTTAAAGVALLNQATSLKGKTAVVLAGTGPVGQRAAVLLAISGASVRLTSRRQSRSVEACDEMMERFGVELTPMLARDTDTTTAALDGAHVVFGAAKSGIQLLTASQWQNHPTLELIADVGTSQVLAFEGINVMDKNTKRFDKIVFGGIGIGALKLKLHRACIAKLFESNDQTLDTEAIYKIAQQMT